jgi:plasmid stability protein
MAQLVVRNLEEEVKTGLRRRAARHGRSMEEEVRDILRDAAKEEAGAAPPLGSWIAGLFSDQGFDQDVPEWHGEAVRPAAFEP